jgi:hypothetical protein
MASLLEVLLTFVGAMLVLALIAQSVQELVKASLAIKGSTARRALERLIMEASRSQGLLDGDARELTEALVRRLAGLGQHGVRPGALRLDVLTAPLLGDLLRTIDPDSVGSLRGLARAQARLRLDAVAAQAVQWFPLAMDPVDDRYRRRMRGLALLSATIVVLGLNADALDIMHRARHDPEFRRRTLALVEDVDSLAAGAAAPDARRPAQVLERIAADSGFVLGTPGRRRWSDPDWWTGILASVLLVSLGAPFWHDLLESLFGLKNRIRAEADKARSEVLPVVVTERIRDAGGATVEKQTSARQVGELP